MLDDEIINNRQSPKWQIQTAVFGQFAVSEPLAAIPCEIYENVPQGVTYPYIELLYFTEDNANTYGGAGKELTMTLNVFSEKGNEELFAIESIIDSILDAVKKDKLDLGEKHRLTYCFKEMSETMPDMLDSIGQLALRYRMRTKQIAN